MVSTPKTFARKIKSFLSLLASGSKRKSSRNHKWPEPTWHRPEEYLPGDVWDSQNPAERFASAGDLCAHLGDQLPVQLVKLIAHDVLQGLKYLHDVRGTTHGDVSQDTILIAPRDMKSIISQFYSDGVSHHTSTASQFQPLYFDFDTLVSPPYSASSVVFRLCYPDIDRPRHDPFCDSYGMRPPEDILGAPRAASSDLWTLGCVLYELLTGESLFDPSFQTDDLGLTPEESHIIQMIEMVGEFPQDLLRSGKHSSCWFRDDGTLRLETTYYPVTLQEILRMRIDESEVINAADFLGSMLQLRPQDRMKAADLLNHPWFMTSS
ncbi:serine kinase [Moniliophthora roreri MCA 2997]|uniref:non-specific serine/threonine protein kinase n=1 Tax=Moniliophthora roreri (strain MCA 2997) TaxID=1381753 RepID=V2WTF1_MONRO|nr:serine kinase [Moniliophthora roreri MCA 2997]